MTRIVFWTQVEASWSKDCDMDFAGDYEILKDSHGRNRPERSRRESPKVEEEPLIKKLLGFRKRKDTEESIINPRTVSKQKIIPETEPKITAKKRPGAESVTTEIPKHACGKDSPRSKLISMLQATNLVYFDLGPRAPIWIIDSPGVMSYIKNLEKLGYSFKYSTKGSKSTQGKAAYYTWLKD